MKKPSKNLFLLLSFLALPFLGIRANKIIVKPYYDTRLLSQKLNIGRYSPFENPTGLYFEKGDKIVVEAPDLKGHQLSLLLVDFSYVPKGQQREKTTRFTLQAGKNSFEAPHKGLVYVSYYEERYLASPQFELNFLTGKNNGVFRADEHSNLQWAIMLNNAVANVIDMQGKYVHLTFDVASLKKKGLGCGVEMIRLYDRIILWQQEFIGMDQFGHRRNNHVFGRISYYGNPNANGKGVSFPKTSKIIDPNDIRRNNWVIGHEFGHIHQVRPGVKWHGTTEITNNIMAAWIQYKLMPEGPYRVESTRANDGMGHRIVGGLLNWHINHCAVEGKPFLYLPTEKFTVPLSDNRDLFVRLSPFWQLQVFNALTYMGRPDFYAQVCERTRKVDHSDMSVGEIQLDFVRHACDVLQQDLSDFFIKSGFLVPVNGQVSDYGGKRPMKITQKQIAKVVKYASKYKKPASPVLHYISLNNVKAYREHLPVFHQPGGVTLEKDFVRISHEYCQNAVAFEAYQNDQLKRVSMVGTGSQDNTFTTAYFPENCNVLYAVSWDGQRIKVYER